MALSEQSSVNLAIARVQSDLATSERLGIACAPKIEDLRAILGEVRRRREALWAIVQETSNDPQRIKDMAREVLGDD